MSAGTQPVSSSRQITNMRIDSRLEHAYRFLAVSVALRAEGKQTSVLNLLKHGEHRARTRLFERDCAHFYADVLIYVEALGRGESAHSC